jgi:serine/threonine protein kinase
METDAVIASFFRLQSRIGKGSYGEVYDAVDVRTNASVAVKLEPVTARFPQLLYEYRVMQELGNQHGFPRVLWFETAGDYNVLIMQKLGRSVEDDRTLNGGTLPLDRVTAIGRQALERLSACHALGFAYRDIKPQNFLFGARPGSNTLYLIDFGLCKRVVDVDTGTHIAVRTDKKMAGTPRYASLHAHAGVEQSRRDDVEALVYMLVFLVHGKLPWQPKPSAGASSSPASMLRRIQSCKQKTSPDKLCAGLPPQFLATLQHAQSLAFDATPDYSYLYDLWRV